MNATAQKLPRLWWVRDMLFGTFIVVFAFAAFGFVMFSAFDKDSFDPRIAAVAILGFECTLGITVLILSVQRGITLADLGFVRPRLWGPLVVAWLGSYVILIVYQAVIMLIEMVGVPVGAFNDGNTINFGSDQNVLLIVTLGIAVTIGAPFGEELLFRGLLFRGLRGYWRLIPAMALSGLLFGIFHVNLSVIVPFSFIGALFAWAYEESGSIWTTIAAHAGVNSASFIVTVLLLE
jgi:membrane protease YdiL (CAAX protease family)